MSNKVILLKEENERLKDIIVENQHKVKLPSNVLRDKAETPQK